MPLHKIYFTVNTLFAVWLKERKLEQYLKNVKKQTVYKTPEALSTFSFKNIGCLNLARTRISGHTFNENKCILMMFLTEYLDRKEM